MVDFKFAIILEAHYAVDESVFDDSQRNLLYFFSCRYSHILDPIYSRL